MSRPSETVTIDGKEDKKHLLELLQKMKLKRRLVNPKDGFVFLIQINLKSGDEVSVVVSSEEITVDNKVYKAGNDYSEEFIKYMTHKK